MVAIIALNALFAIIVVGGVVGLLARSIWTSRLDAPAQPGRSRAQTKTARRLAAVTG
ncbi:MAG TPA: hypothetical protein VG405_06400 [Solirubrobacteraceae bacterium]|jgi:hypothetical protein|nr:hypothetical protein [Solirubrobacteraceae bacterium]